MFETESFRDELERTVSAEAANNNMTHYQTAAINFLQEQARQNEPILMDREIRKAAGTRRGIPDALASARELVKEAAQYAAADKRTLITRADIEKAHNAKFCRVWPFCKQ
jgi:hypothetical protein